MNFTEAIQDVIRRSGKNLVAISELTGVSVAQLWRFMANERSLHLDSADKLASGLGLNVKLTRTRKAKGR